MQEVFEKIISKINEKIEHYDSRHKILTDSGMFSDADKIAERMAELDFTKEIVKQEAEQYNNGWIPCSEKMPPVETEVFIVTKRKYRGGKVQYITTTAMYEDGTVLENDSCWRWEDIDGEWDEENDCYIIPEGWWENRHYNPDEVYNNAVDDEVVAWQPLTQPYQPKGE